MTKPKWEKEMEDYFGNMTDEDFRDFLKETEYDFYKNVKTPLTGVPELDALEDGTFKFTSPESKQSQPSPYSGSQISSTME